jgi:hypothetical protein
LTFFHAAARSTSGLITSSESCRFIDFNRKDAEKNELAICSSLVYFKHRWPGQACVLEGPEEFRIRAWRIAEELGIRVQGPRPGSGKVTRY